VARLAVKKASSNGSGICFSSFIFRTLVSQIIPSSEPGRDGDDFSRCQRAFLAPSQFLRGTTLRRTATSARPKVGRRVHSWLSIPRCIFPAPPPWLRATDSDHTRLEHRRNLLCDFVVVASAAVARAARLQTQTRAVARSRRAGWATSEPIRRKSPPFVPLPND